VKAERTPLCKFWKLLHLLKFLNLCSCQGFTTIPTELSYTGHTQKNGAVLTVFTIKTASFFCVCSVYVSTYKRFVSNSLYVETYTGHTQKNGAVLTVFTIKTAPFFCVCPVYVSTYKRFVSNRF
jgi:hypothetical protein